MSDSEVESKFRKLCAGRVSKERADAILSAVWGLEERRDVGELIDLLVLDQR
jgi:hypothetical protein